MAAPLSESKAIIIAEFDVVQHRRGMMGVEDMPKAV